MIKHTSAKTGADQLTEGAAVQQQVQDSFQRLCYSVTAKVKAMQAERKCRGQSLPSTDIQAKSASIIFADLRAYFPFILPQGPVTTPEIIEKQ